MPQPPLCAKLNYLISLNLHIILSALLILTCVVNLLSPHLFFICFICSFHFFVNTSLMQTKQSERIKWKQPTPCTAVLLIMFSLRITSWLPYHCLPLPLQVNECSEGTYPVSLWTAFQYSDIEIMPLKDNHWSNTNNMQLQLGYHLKTFTIKESSKF